MGFFQRLQKERVRKHLVKCFLIVAGISGMLFISSARADYLPLSGAEVANNIAEIRIENEGVYVQLEIFVGDASKFETLIPSGWFSTDVSGRPSKEERLIDFAETGLTVRREDGTALPVQIKLFEPRVRIDRTTALTGQRDPITGREFPKPPDDPRVIFTELFYDFGGRRPDVIEITPPMTAQGLPAATIGFVTFDRGVPVANFGYLSGSARLAIDWNDPWYSRFENANLRRHHQSGATTYLYVEPRELRHETLIRVRDIDPWLGLELTPGHLLSPDEQAQIKADAASLLAGRNSVMIDGKEATPAHNRSELLTLDTTGLQIVEENHRLSADQAFVGVILSFPWHDLPEKVAVQWDMFSETISQVPATSTDPAGPFLGGATPDDPEIVWRNHLLTYQNPRVDAVSVGGVRHVRVPVLSAIGLFVALVAGGLAIVRNGRVRIGSSIVALSGLVVTALASNVATADIRNPFVRIPETADATAAFSALLENINAANLEVTAAARENALKPIVTSRSHIDVAAELDRALAVRVPGGGVARVTEVKDVILEELSSVDDDFGFRAFASWTARASAGHWGHTHRRVVEYRALVEVIDDAGTWKLDGITVIETRIPNA